MMICSPDRRGRPWALCTAASARYVVGRRVQVSGTRSSSFEVTASTTAATIWSVTIIRLLPAWLGTLRVWAVSPKRRRPGNLSGARGGSDSGRRGFAWVGSAGGDRARGQPVREGRDPARARGPGWRPAPDHGPVGDHDAGRRSD